MPFFFKQWGGTNKARTGGLLDGSTWDELPVSPSDRLQTTAPVRDTTVMPSTR